ncbi:MAG: ATP-binding protein [Trebonia sp.]
MREMIDRHRERQRLVDATQTTPALIVVIGRRRVGKSFLLERTFNGEHVISFQGDEQDESHQLELFAAEAGRVLLGSDALRFASWDAALSFLGEQARTTPLTVILDEFQWLKRAQPALDSIIQRHWDRWDREALPVTLILAGSALTLMEQLLERGAALFGRATARPRVEPLDYRDAAGFTTDKHPESLLRRWAVLGGTPQYQVWAGDGPLSDIITNRILAKDAALYDEPRHLLREGEGIRDPGTYLSILRAIAYGATQHNEIAQQAKATSAGLAPKLARLEDLGYIERRFPLTADEREQRPGYHIEDPFFRFWFRYVAGNRSRLERHRVAEVSEEVHADMDNTMGWAFERCCRRWATAYADEKVTGTPRQIGSWWSRDGQTEIDVVGVSRHRYTLLGSCKWRRVVDNDVLDQLRDHQAVLGGRAAAARLIIFGRDQFTPALRERAAAEDIRLVSATHLFHSS